MTKAYDAGVWRRLAAAAPHAALLSFHARAQPLWVGPAVVFRASLRLGSGRDTPSHAWVVAIGHAKFRAFHAHARAVLLLPPVVAHDEAPVVARFLNQMGLLLHHYQWLDAAFEIPLDGHAWHDAQRTMEAFLWDCWTVVESLVPLLAAAQGLPVGRHLQWLFVLLRDLLAVPDRVLQTNWALATAVLCLRDATVANGDRDCSVCLDVLDTREKKLANTGDPLQSMGDGGVSRVVTLPCRHLLHEQCVLEWLRYSLSCPECRASVS